MTQTLTALGGHVCPYIPDRFDEGYGLNVDALTKLAGEGVRVVLTVDCGIRSVAEVMHGNRQGMDMILTDHHSPAARSFRLPWRPSIPNSRIAVIPSRNWPASGWPLNWPRP